MLTGSHDYTKESFDLIVKPIVLEDGVWVGAKATVCPGVTLKTHSVLAVGSVATKELDAYGVYQGNPAILKRLREIR
jgi:putative colanic acid biosynthesis acetyltransferase WcaF